MFLIKGICEITTEICFYILKIEIFSSFLMSGGDDSVGKLKTVTRLVPYRIKRIGSTESEESPPPTPKGVVKKERSCKDEKAAKDLKIPYTIEYIINCGMDDFGDILNDKTLNEEQLSLCREIRKRGKNKVNFD